MTDNIIDIYTRHADAWDRKRTSNPQTEQKWLEYFVTLMKPFGTVLDLGCGSGRPIAGYLIDSGFIVSGVDASAPLIAICRRRFPENTWLVEDMRKLDLKRRFDAIIAWDSLFHLTPGDQRRMFKIFSEHAAPKAVLMFTSGPKHGEAIGEFCGEPLYHASLSAEEYAGLLERYGFEIVEHIAKDPECGGHTVWLAQLLH